MSSNVDSDGQAGLFDAPELAEPADLGHQVPRGGWGRIERGLIDSAKHTGIADDLGKRAALLMCMATARALDVSETKSNPYATAQLAKAYLDQLTALGLAEPVDKPDDDDPFSDIS